MFIKSELCGKRSRPAVARSNGVRKAGHIEQYFNVYSRAGFCGWVVMAGRYQTPSGAPLGVGDKATLFAALEQVVRGHAALHSRLPPPSESPEWKRLSSIDLNEVVQFLDKDGSSLRAIIEDLFARDMDFPEDTPRWKLLVLLDGTLMFVWDHSIGDGQSALAFHHALLSALNRIRSESHPHSEHSGIISDLPSDLALPPSLEDAAGSQMSVPFPMLVRVLAEEYLPFMFARDKHAAVWTGNPVPTTITPQTQVRILHYSPSETSELLRASREHSATLTGTLHTLALVVLSRLIRALPDDEGAAYDRIASFLPISMRRHTHVPPTAMCVHLSHYEGHHPVFPPDIDLDSDSDSDSEFPWDAAAAFTATLKRAVERAGPITAMMKYLFGRYEEYFRAHLGKKRAAGLAISNVGAFPRPTTESGEGEGATRRWRIREMTFAQADATLAAALKLNVVGSPDGGLGVAVTWGTSAADGGLAEAFVAALDGGLRILAGSAKPL